METEGMAPECRLLAVKCLGLVVGTGTTSWIIHAIEESLDWGADIISMSLGGDETAERPEDNPYYPVFEKLREADCIPVVAAGNSGPRSGSVGSPGSLPNCLSVGAYDPVTGEIADFSSRGPVPWRDVKPDCVAPGVNVHAPCVNALDLSDQIPQRFSVLSGTSMATPHVSGLVALAKQAWRELLGRELTLGEILNMLSRLGDYKTNDAGWGKIDWWMFEEWLSTQYGVEPGRRW